MNWNKFETFFHESFHSKMRPFIESEECDKIYEHLKKEAKRGKKIAPISSNVFRCFLETPLTNLKVVMVGMCPYHTERNGVPIADGLLMGCSTTGVLQPSLQNFYNGVEKELYNGLNLNANKSADVIHLAHQGVLMLNAGLTTEINVAGSHIAIWEPFIKYFFEHVIPYEGVPIIFLGKDASRWEKYTPSLSTSFTLSHPASAAYKQTEWDTEGVFGKVNKLLKDNNNFEIDWLDTVPF